MGGRNFIGLINFWLATIAHSSYSRLLTKMENLYATSNLYIKPYKEYTVLILNQERLRNSQKVM